MLLIILTENSFEILIRDEFVFENSIQINSVDFFIDKESMENKGFIGFFDWLRSDEHSIVGIRICYFVHLKYHEVFKKYFYLNFDTNENIELLFENTNYDDSISGDQDFTNNYVYKSNEGNYLLTFGIDNLTDMELKSIEALSHGISKR